MFRLGAVLSIMSLIVPVATAGTLDCSSPTALTCGVTSNGVTIGSGAVPADPDWCSGQFTGNTFAHIFELTVASDMDITVNASNPLITLFLLTACDQDACHPGAVGQGTPSVMACVTAGTYLVAATTPVDAIFTYTMATACEPCVPVPNEACSWGVLKARFSS